MAIDQKIVEFINADIDGEISPAEKRELDVVLANDTEASAFHAEMATLCHAMNSTDSVEPPVYLRHVIMQILKPRRDPARSASLVSRLFSAPALRVAGAFAAGVILALSFISSDRISRDAFEDVTGLVGTMSDSAGKLPIRDNISISRKDIAGTVKLHKSGQLLVVDFDLISQAPVVIVAEFSDPTIWFNGFAQLATTGTSVAAQPGQVTLSMEGKRRYAIYLHDSGSRDATINLKFVASETVIHEAQLSIR
jgi:hypothetical protein